MTTVRVPVVENILNANDFVANENRKIFSDHKIFCINIMAAPGAGKTALIVKTIALLKKEMRIGVIEGDTASVTIDSDKVTLAGAPAVQVTTMGECHMDAMMVRKGMEQLPLDSLDLVIIENIGNLICPAEWDLGSHANALIASVAEGDDKPYKYPNIYRNLNVLLVTKTDLIPYVEYDIDRFRTGVELLNPGLITFPTSAKTGEGFEPWLTWLKSKVADAKA
ncbi:hydrogenase nickel incorporation protein HypB [Flexilinea flocculi]|jgi:hydrogenase nickel incorporation protein HypB|uniref:Hydrogenase nickel incorporation protein HypB n=1 Tax=Flexilinea flocculi TaxID=1678840 RepID=A0A0S7BTU2_9CHLR|nr:hydrogenase nickel incorporation protein HypB [Flexilinea flocculi]NMB92582.1 hydrogenase nickel incorporation protein HypB [Flexilinea flocculi]GAP40644.1 hydrogenase nickel incorporation protein HypB [Flexilinea flocculi]